MTRSYALAAAATLGLSLVASAAQAGRCDDWGCGTNGVALNGMNMQGTLDSGIVSQDLILDRLLPEEEPQGPLYSGIAPQELIAAEQPAVHAVVLPSGEIIDLR
jgi:hypothetical protein